MTTYFLSRFIPSVPYTVVVFLIGAFFSLSYGNVSGTVNDSLFMWYTIDPELILFIFLPALLFGESMGLNFYQIRCTIGASSLLAGPGALFGALCIGILSKLCLPFQWSWSLSLILGVILCPTDPVAVVALVKKIGASTKLTYLITGESLLNDATALVLYNLLFSLIAVGNKSVEISVKGVIVYFLEVVFISPLIGAAFGFGSVFCIGLLNHRMRKEDTIMQISVTMCCAYLSFFVAEYSLEVSGVLSCCTAGVVLAVFSPALIFEPESMESVWSTIEWIGNTLIFTLAGLIIGKRCIYFLTSTNLGYLLLLYVLLFVVRFLMICLCCPILWLFNDNITINETLFLTWGGLRGAVSMALALSLSNSIADGRTTLEKDSSDVVFFFIGGIAALTLLINATSCGFLLHYLQLVDEDKSSEKRVIFSYLKWRLHWKAEYLINQLKDEHSLYFTGDFLTKYHANLSHSLEVLEPSVMTTSHEHHELPSEEPEDRELEGSGESKSKALENTNDVITLQHACYPSEFELLPTPPRPRLPSRETNHPPLPSSQRYGQRHRASYLFSYWKQIKSGKLPRNSPATLILVGSIDRAIEKQCLQEGLMDWKIIVESYSFFFSAAQANHNRQSNSNSNASFEDVEGENAPELRIGSLENIGEVEISNNINSDSFSIVSIIQNSTPWLHCKELIRTFRLSQLVNLLLGFISAHEYAQKKIPQYMGATEEADTLEQVLVVKESKALVILARKKLSEIDTKILQQIVCIQSARRILHMEEDAIEEFSKEGLLSILDAEHLLHEIYER